MGCGTVALSESPPIGELDITDATIAYALEQNANGRASLACRNALGISPVESFANSEWLKVLSRDAAIGGPGDALAGPARRRSAFS